MATEMTATTPMPDTPPKRPTENLSRSSSSSGLSLGFFSVPFEKFMKESEEWTADFTLLDTIETYFDSRIDLLERRLKKQGDILKARANEQLAKIKPPTSDKYTKDIEAEVKKFRHKVSKRMASLQTAWQSTKVIRTREKVSFLIGVLSILWTAVVMCLAPDWLHIVYTVQTLYYLPIRYYTYKKKAWHYFLFDLCYYVNVLSLIYIWFLPSSSILWHSCYLLTHGSLASAVVTWRNSLVFHDAEKVTSLYIHIYPPLVFTVIRHFYPNVSERFPAATGSISPVLALMLSAIFYIIWQGLYWKLVLVNRRTKVESGQRTTSFSWLLNDKRGVIGRMLQGIPPQYRLLSFITGQLVYTIVTEIPALFLYHSPIGSLVFMFLIFSVSVWNGASYYVEVFGRKFERELEALRKELAESRLTIATIHPNGNLNGLGSLPHTPGEEHEHDQVLEIPHNMHGKDDEHGYGYGEPMSSGVSVASDVTSEMGNSPFMVPTTDEHGVGAGEVKEFRLDVGSAGDESRKDR